MCPPSQKQMPTSNKNISSNRLAAKYVLGFGTPHPTPSTEVQHVNTKELELQALLHLSSW